MAKVAKPLEPGERAPNIFLPDQRDIIISLYDKVKGGPILLLFYPAAAEPRSAAELSELFEIAPGLLAGGVHVFSYGGDDVATTAALAKQHGAEFFMLSDGEGRAAESCGVPGQLTAFVLDPNQRALAQLVPGETSLAAQAKEIIDALAKPAPFPAHAHPPILVIPEAFDRAFCRYLIAQYWQRGNEESGTFRMVDGKMVHKPHHDVKRRRDHHVLDKDLLDKIGDKFRGRVIPEIKRAFQFDVTRVEEFKIVCYESEPGGYFYTHRDNTTPQTQHRRFAMTLVLNAEDFEGGALRFPEFGGATYQPGTGDAVVFSCNLLHEVLDVTAGHRFVLLSFLYDEAGQRQLEAYRGRVEAQRRA
ncbi:MAG: 2OG-Fe(II) oxygenase [Alphaproteobacteria bacterium]